MVESAFNRPTPVQEQQAALKAEPKTPTRIEPRADDLIVLMDPVQPIHGTVTRVTLTDEEVAATRDLKPGEAWAKAGQSLEPEPPAKVEDLDEF
jgi:hypothetical protein